MGKNGVQEAEGRSPEKLKKEGEPVPLNLDAGAVTIQSPGRRKRDTSKFGAWGHM